LFEGFQAVSSRAVPIPLLLTEACGNSECKTCPGNCSKNGCDGIEGCGEIPIRQWFMVENAENHKYCDK
jgi:hypothetical protein